MRDRSQARCVLVQPQVATVLVTVADVVQRFLKVVAQAYSSQSSSAGCGRLFSASLPGINLSRRQPKRGALIWSSPGLAARSSSNMFRM